MPYTWVDPHIHLYIYIYIYKYIYMCVCVYIRVGTLFFCLWLRLRNTWLRTQHVGLRTTSSVGSVHTPHLACEYASYSHCVTDHLEGRLCSHSSPRLWIRLLFTLCYGPPRGSALFTLLTSPVNTTSIHTVLRTTSRVGSVHRRFIIQRGHEHTRTGNWSESGRFIYEKHTSTHESKKQRP